MTWSLEEAEAHLLSLELFGMRFGLERMRRLLTALGSPQKAFAPIHVVGTNGKSSTVRFTAALLEAHGVRTGAFLSPHLTSFSERVRIGDADLEPAAFGAAVQRAAAAAAKVDRTLPDGERVTQFELVTAAAFDELARRGVEVAVIEAGLGGRHDATNVLEAPVCVLTSVGLEHTRWLGPTVRDIAREKLAVVPEGATLVLGDVPPEAEEEALATDATIVRRPRHRRDAPRLPDRQLRARRRRGARPARRARPGQGRRRRGACAGPRAPPDVGDAPLTILDGAHNPSGVAALVEALDGVVGDRPLVAVVSVLDDKDAASMLRELLAPLRRARLHALGQPARAAAGDARLAGRAARRRRRRRPVEIVAAPHAAMARARELAGPDGAVLATGSIYLVADLLRPEGARRVSAL